MVRWSALHSPFEAPDSILAKIYGAAKSLAPDDAASFLENCQELEDLYAEMALQGDSQAPDDAEEEVDFHFVCFAASATTHHLFELDGDFNGPVDTGKETATDENYLSQACIEHVREYIGGKEDGEDNMRFNLLALTHIPVAVVSPG